ncbi:MAG: hypothetical protein OXG72_08945 [Acidobacteria bacterium]|nr:hypothetical protein [Acidobacteriota bacterium]
MPYLRFFRDERGYEHTYVLHGLRTSSRPRLLYWFRTPPNVNMGRLPLDEDAIRAIEDANGDLTFDWARMLRVKPKPAAARGDDAGGRRTGGQAGARRQRSRGAAATIAADEPVEASTVEEGSEAGPSREPETRTFAPRGHPVAALVGDEGLARLRAQYAELRARVAESRAGARLREEVAARVEALNPDGWRAGEEAVLGIERFEAQVTSIKGELGRRRRRSRGRRRQEETPGAEQADEPGEATSE